MVLTLADRWKKLPQEIEAADAGMLRLLEIVQLGTPEKSDDTAMTGEEEYDDAW
jgi:hypothetical protein